MAEVVSVLNKVLVRQFYKLNAGFFLLIITLAFGFMSGVEHRALAEFFIASPVLLLIPAGTWAIYLMKIVNFNRQQIALNENYFLREVALVPRSLQCMALGVTFTAQFMPALLYGAFLTLMAMRHGMTSPAGIVISILILQLVAGAAILFRDLNYFPDEVKVSFLKRFLDNRFKKPLAQFYLEWIVRHEPALVIGTKLFSALLLYAICKLYEGEGYDARLIGLGVTLSFSASFMIIAQLHHFENSRFSLLRNLPLSLVARALTFLVVLLMLSLPETGILLNYFPHTLEVTDACSAIAFGISIGMVFYAVHFLLAVRRGDDSRWVFALVMLWFLLILFRTPVIALALSNFVAASFLMRRYFYSFESF